ncbi:hypothetical protein PHYBLDRAFT_175804 [Phycomyces blakesleeanus NRRL 1555(-)]|uniref:Homeodomain-like DNA binding domain-containing transcription factor n=1 Tax=Phycomyces blakesleeanus (strain ATCC 8743b / DSM 1359 / FGSC 10004 / NBRC 33097 / NRRL 1555) TaxID=763407 RepID=A0A163CV99_PHYB8|nr:hypothetical protein PHYBLDRAFT_175804 [Phycomyces blakesleeanus NRRL 1555(-)]OAD65840.1 hypothetical protein PHYBLDRAFT_175804 [Phycomyces blakesleeanus NRRL 1555(-)]|eukprot:XP_018283880.1 hypothetical protein PHYBLDRAFT_175804 [Phycomyces blakesleeanus NRRL 1555(-)]
MCMFYMNVQMDVILVSETSIKKKKRKLIIYSNLEALTNIRNYCESQGPERESKLKDPDTRIEDVANLLKRIAHNRKPLFVYYNRVKLYSAAKFGSLVGGSAERTAQKWAKRFKEDKNWNILEKKTRKVIKRSSQLYEEHKVYPINFYDEYSHAQVSDAVATLTEKSGNFTL